MQKRNSHARRDRADTPKTENSTHFSQIRSSEDGKSRVTLRWERIKPQNRGQFGSGRKDSNRKRNTSTTSNGTRKHTPGTSRSGERIHGTSPSGERIHDTSERIKHRDSGLFFSPDNIVRVRNAFDTARDDRTELATISPFADTVTRKKLRCLSVEPEEQWLNDEVVNFIMRTHHNDHVCCFNSFLYSKLMKSTGRRLNVQYDYPAVCRMSNKVKEAHNRHFDKKVSNIFDFRKILLPIHIPMHWVLVVIDLEKQTFEYLDSLNKNGDKGRDILQYARKWLRDESIDKKVHIEDIEKWALHIRKDIPQQNNNSDCGMYMTKFAEYASKNKELRPESFGPADIVRFRAEYVLKILDIGEYTGE